MTNKTKDFSYSNSPEPHKARTRAILKDHPEVRNLIGRNSASFFLILFVVALQIAISFLIKDYPWWSALIAAYLIGLPIIHFLF